MVKNVFKIKMLPFFIVLILILSFSESILANPSSKQRVYDFANLLSSEEIKELEEISEKYSDKRETDFVILTTADTKGKDVVEFMQDFYDEEALGYDKPHGNTAILTLDMEHREVYLAAFYKGEEYLDDSRLDTIRYKIGSDLSDGEYYNAFERFIKLSYKYMGIKPGVNPESILFNLWFQIIVSLSIAGIIVGIMASNSGGRVTVNEGTYRDFNSSKVLQRRDNYLRTSVTKHKKPSNNNKTGGGSFGGGGGGGGTTSGGHFHSGSRGSF